MSRFLNVVYSVMVERLTRDEKQPERPRHDFDARVDVRAWGVPGGEPVKRVVVEGAPYWWHGDEDASQQFLLSMGVS